MESKGGRYNGDSKKGDDACVENKNGDLKMDDVDATFIQPDKNLIMKFSEYAFRILNVDMTEFFEAHVDVFDQSEEELNCGQGETLEQYEVFQKYCSKLETYFDEFATREKFRDVSSCFDAINDCISEDKVARKKMMRELAKHLRDAQRKFALLMEGNQAEEAEEVDAKADAKSSGSGGGASKKGEGDLQADSKQMTALSESKAQEGEEEDDVAELMPVMMFFQPTSMETILQQVLTLTEYKTFSAIMRSKVRQIHLLRKMRAKLNKQEEDADARESDMERGLYGEVFFNLVDRLCELTPGHPTLVAQTRQVLSEQAWDKIAVDLEVNEEWLASFKRMNAMLSMLLMQLCSFEYRNIIRDQFSLIISAATPDTPAQVLVRKYLSCGHDSINAIEKQVVLALETNQKKSGNTSGAQAK